MNISVCIFPNPVATGEYTDSDLYSYNYKNRVAVWDQPYCHALLSKVFKHTLCRLSSQNIDFLQQIQIFNSYPIISDF